MKKKYIKILIIIFFLLVAVITFKNNFYKNDSVENKSIKSEDVLYSSNIIKNVNYVFKDTSGNEYIIKSLEGEIDYNNPNIIYLTDVKALIKLDNSNDVKIKSDFGRYNADNFDTIFSKNVLITYLDNKITGEYLDFSINRNSMIVSRDVVYTNLQNILKADVIDIDINTKDTKIFMYKNNQKVKIKDKN